MSIFFLWWKIFTNSLFGIKFRFSTIFKHLKSSIHYLEKEFVPLNWKISLKREMSIKSLKKHSLGFMLIYAKNQ